MNSNMYNTHDIDLDDNGNESRP